MLAPGSHQVQSYAETGQRFSLQNTSRFIAKPTRNTKPAHSFVLNNIQAEVPDNAIPVDPTKVSDGWRVITPSLILHPEECIDDFPVTFQDYVDLLPNYDAMLIQRVDFLRIDIYQTYESLFSSSSLLLVSNSCANDNRGSTGWIVSNNTGQRLLRGSGSVPGLDPQSYRAEGYAMVSGLTVLKHICLFCGHINTLPLRKLYCHNLGLIKKASNFFMYRLEKVKCVLHSEYDVVNQIFRLLQEYTATPEINHVKGHQDNKIPYTCRCLQIELFATKVRIQILHETPANRQNPPSKRKPL